MNIARPVVRPITHQIQRALTELWSRFITPKPGDYLLDARNGNYLTDESGDKLTA